MPAQILGGRIHDHRRAMVERPHQHRRRRVVHDQRNAHRPPQRRHLRDREHFQRRVRQRLRVPRPCPLIGRLHERRRVRRVNEPHFDPLVLQRIGKQVPRPAIQVGGRHDVVPRPRQVLHRQRTRRLPRRHRQRPHPPFHRRHPLLQRVRRRVHDAGIDVPQLLQREQVRRMVRAVELKRRRLINRHGDRAGALIPPPTGMDGHGVWVH